MRTTNFKCPKTGKEFFHTFHKIKIIEGEAVYTDKQGVVLVNPENNVALEYIEVEGKITTPHFGVGKGADGKKKMQKMLKKRSRKDYKKNVEEKARQMYKDSSGPKQ